MPILHREPFSNLRLKLVPSLEEQLESRKLVDRAKGRLMDDHGMTEGAAFSFIQKTAMRERRTMRHVADEILSGALAPPTA